MRAAEEEEVMTAEEEEAAEAPEVEVVEEGGEDDAAADELPWAATLAKVSAALEEGSADTGVVSEVEEELKAMLARATAAEALAVGLEEQVAASKDSYLRLNADFENFRRRTDSEKAMLASKAKGDVMEALLPVIDNFDLAQGQIKAETEGEEKIVKGYRGLYTQLVQAFKTEGLEVVPTVGAPFDPAVHEAIMREPSEEYAEDVVMEEFRKGFMMGDRLVRPAMVKVSQGGSGGGGQGATEEGVAEEAGEAEEKAEE